MTHQYWKVVLVLGTLVWWSPTSIAISSPGEAARDVVKRGTVELGVDAGFWQATTVVGNSPSANRSAVFVLPRAGLVLTDPVGSGWWQGNVEVMLEPFFARFTKPYAAESAGGSLVLKYNLLGFGRWMPFWDVGGGMAWSNLAPRIPEESTQFQFVVETGPGAHYFMTETVALTMGLRYHHFSNAGLGDRNTGLNALLSYIGVSVFLPE